MFNFKKVSEVIKKVTSTVLTATLSLGMFSASPINAMGGGGNYDCLKRIVFIGSEKSGKTQLIKCMEGKNFKDEYIATFNGDVILKKYQCNNKNCKFHFWDIAGKDIYLHKMSVYYSDASAIVLTVAYDDENWENSMGEWLEEANKNVKEMVSVKVVLTKSDLEEKKFTKEKVEKHLKNINKDTYTNLNIDTTVIETSAKNNTGINYKGNEEGNEEGNSQTCLKDYLLDLFKKQQEQLDLQQKVSPELNLSESSEPKNKSEIDHNMQNKPSVFEKAAGVAKKHPAISIGAAVTLATVFVVTPLVIFKNKIIKGVKTISAKIKNKKPVAKKIRTVH